MDNSFLSQEEIDALLRSDIENENLDEETTAEKETSDSIEDLEDLLSPVEKDALGELGNISAGSSSTALSELLGQKVIIDTPTVTVTTPKLLYESFRVPYVLIEVTYTSGIEGTNVLVLKVSDAAVICDLMMGGTGENPSTELNELQLSAVSEAMNQMVGSAATSMSTIFNKRVEISPPTVFSVDYDRKDIYSIWDEDKKIAVTSFNLKIGDILESEILQIVPLEVAKESINLLLGNSFGSEEIEAEPEEEVSEQIISETHSEQAATAQVLVDDEVSEPVVNRFQSAQEEPVIFNNRNLDLILDIPLKISVVLGKTKKPINEILNLGPGSIVELQKIADEPVDILVNGIKIAEGEVVVVNENFGVKILNIISHENRIRNLGKQN